MDTQIVGVQACVHCGETDCFITDYHSGDYICQNCGTVQPEQVIDEGQEWRDFGDEDNGESRARAEKVDDDFNSLGTNISLTNFGSNTISNSARNLAKYQRIAHSDVDKTEQQLRESFKKLEEYVELLQLPQSIKQIAKEIIKNYEKKKEKGNKGLKKDAFLLAVLLLASKHEHGGRTLRSLSQSTHVEEKDIKRFYKILLRDPTLIQVGSTTRKSTKEEVLELVELFCNKLKQPYDPITKDAKEVAKNAIEFLEGKRPSSVAAASLLFIFNARRLPQNQQELSTVAGISTNTLRNVYKELNKHIDQLPFHIFQIKANIHLVN